jgi:hypothetical protein
MRAGGSELALDFRHWVNHGLMAFFFFLLPFFFVTGLEIRREFDMGELRERRRLATPLGRGRAPEVIARLRARARDNRITLVTATRELAIRRTCLARRLRRDRLAPGDNACPSVLRERRPSKQLFDPTPPVSPRPRRSRLTDANVMVRIGS